MDCLEWICKPGLQVWDLMRPELRVLVPWLWTCIPRLTDEAEEVITVQVVKIMVDQITISHGSVCCLGRSNEWVICITGGVPFSLKVAGYQK
jgi:hypothetical protein